jgi:hypothetical protein
MKTNMNKAKIGTIKKNDIKITEYDSGTHSYSDKFFIQSGPIGFWATEKELKDLYVVLNYYLNIETFSEVEVEVE